MRCVFLILATAVCAFAADLPASVCDVTVNGAKGGGVVLDTAAIQKAIDACAAGGGGVVWFPTGNFLSGTIVLKSNVTLHLSPGATLWGSKKIEDYNPNHLIYAKDAENIAIEGGGVIDGNGLSYFDTNSQFSPEQWFLFKYNSKERPSPLIELVTCHNVRVQDLSLRNSRGGPSTRWGPTASRSMPSPSSIIGKGRAPTALTWIPAGMCRFRIPTSRRATIAS